MDPATKKPSELALEMRAAIREALLGDDWRPGGSWWSQVKMLMPTRMRHEYKKKFLNEEEALWWAEKEGFLPSRAYSCHWCPFWHLTTKRLRTSRTSARGES